MLSFNNESIRDAVKAWLRDPNAANKEYGHISRWDVSKVTNMSRLFADSFYRKFQYLFSILAEVSPDDKT